jgi:uncharacterized membrane protein HdeD (DUF308 family)
MNEASPFTVHTMSGSELESLRASRVFLMIMGVALIILGAVSISSSFIATLATVLMFGVVLLVGAGFQVVTAFLARRWTSGPRSREAMVSADRDLMAIPSQ